jgi:hypothetical protein
MNTGIDGGMNKVFAAKLPDGNTGLSEGGDGQGLSLLALSRAPGTIPSHVNPPKPKLTAEEEPVSATTTSAPATRVAAATPTQREPAQSEGWFSSLARKVGLGGSDTTASAPPPPAKPKAESKPAAGQSIVRATAAAPKQAEPKQAAAKPAAPALKPSVADAPAPAAAAPAPAATIAGSQPVVSSNSFESRFGAMK